MNYVLHVVVVMGIYAVLALSLNLVIGYAGLLSLCHAAFFGIGAYVTALLMLAAGWGFLLSLGAAIVITSLLSLVVAIPSLRLKGDHFVLATLGFQIIVSAILYNWTQLTRGPFGIAAIPAPFFLGIEAEPVGLKLVVVAIIGGGCALVVWWLSDSPFARVLEALREDEVAALSLGKNVDSLKTVTFAIAAGLAACAGGLFAVYVGYIDPTSFTVMESVLFVSMVIVGGAGSFTGPLIGVAFIVLLPELLRFVNVPDPIAANLREIVYGLLLIVLMRLRPQGLLGRYGFE